MKNVEIEKRLRKVMQDLQLTHQGEKAESTENLFSLGVLDSLILVQYVLALEDELKISIPNTEITFENFKTFQDQVTLIEKLKKELNQ